MGYEAFKKTTQYKNNQVIGGLTPDKRFFLGYGMAWMVNIRPEALANQVRSDVHSPARFRINGPLSDIDAFYKIFDVKPGDAMNSGTQAAREAGNMVDLDSNPTKLIEVVETGKQLLMTRGSLTTFSIANDVSKYFAIIPAIAAGLYAGANGQGVLSALNIMHLATPQSAILSAVIFNALIIVLLIPLALKGVKYRPLSSNRILAKNLLVYGLGGLVVPFIGIKLIDIVLQLLHCV